jgi:hypothetical protein
MILKDAREHYYFHTGKVSDIVRQLALGAIAVVWLFRSGEAGSFAVPAELLLSLKLVVAGLAIDLLQYASGAALWGIFQWRQERGGILESVEFKAPSWINWPALLCFWLKVFVIAYAYCLLLVYLGRTVSGAI